MQVSNQLIYMSCFPQPFDKIFMCSLQINHCHSQSLSLSVNRLAAKRRLPEKTFQAAGHFYLYLFIYFLFLFFFFYIIIIIIFILLLLLVGDIPFSGDFNKSVVRWDQNKLFY